jgi:hypothetical protein
MTLRRFPPWLVIALPLVGVPMVGVIGAPQTPAAMAPLGDSLVAGFKSTYAASVSDAIEIVTGKDGSIATT